jgi:hypothetical protein
MLSVRAHASKTALKEIIVTIEDTFQKAISYHSKKSGG